MSARSMALSASVELTWRDYDARETSSSGFVLNREKGGLPGAALGIGADSPAGCWRLQVAHEGGQVAYRGITQLAVPLRTTTRLDVDRVAFGWRPPIDPVIASVSVQPWLQLTHQRINRSIHPTPISSALTEILDATLAQGGLALHVPVAERLGIEAAGQLSRPLRQRLAVDTFGFYDNFVLTPHARTSWRASLAIVWRPAPALRTELKVSREQWRFGRSGSRDISRDGTVVGSAYYPGSRQDLDGISLRIEYHLRVNIPR